MRCRALAVARAPRRLAGLRAAHALLALTGVVSLAPAELLAQVPVDRIVQREQFRIQRNPRDTGAYDRLGDAYMQKMRETGDVSYLSLAEQALSTSLRIAPDNGRAVRHLAHVFSTRHEFRAAAEQARKAIELDASDGEAYGVLGDALLELGLYDQAGDAYDRMMRLRSDLASYSRRSGLESLRGEPRAAIEDLRRAVTAGRSAAQPRESIAWAQFQLGVEHFTIGEIDAAEAQQLAALDTYPGYHRALAGLGQVRAAQGRHVEAVDLYRKALAVAPLPEYAAALGDVYAAMHRDGDARKQHELVEYIGRLTALNQALYNRELAYFYADHGIRLARAVELATNEIAMRQDIYAHDVLAWALHAAGRSREAVAPIEQALRLGTRDPRLFFHAGMIYRAAGDHGRAREYLARALSINPQFHVLQAAVARDALAGLTAAARTATAPR